MAFQFEKTNNRDKIHGDKNIQYLVNMAFNSDEETLKTLIQSLNLDKKYQLRYLQEMKEYYNNKGIIFNDDYEEYINNFVELNPGTAKGSFLEVLSYKLLKKYCNIDKIYDECYVYYNGIKDSHPYDIIAIDNYFIHMIDMKFSCKFLDKKHLDYLIKFKRKENNIKSYFFSLDSFTRVELKINNIKNNYNMKKDTFENLINDINWICEEDIINAILNKKCLLDY